MTSQVMPPRAEKPTTPSRSPASFYRPMSERALEEASQARLSDLEADRAPEEVTHFAMSTWLPRKLYIFTLCGFNVGPPSSNITPM